MWPGHAWQPGDHGSRPGRSTRGDIVVEAWRRPTDWANVVLGVILLVLTFSFAGANAGYPVAFRIGVGIGVLLVPISLYLLASKVEMGMLVLETSLALVRSILRGVPLPLVIPAAILALPLFIAATIVTLPSLMAQDPAFRAGAARLTQLGLALLLFLAPWVLGFAGLTAMAWTCRVVGSMVFIGAAVTTLGEYVAHVDSGNR